MYFNVKILIACLILLIATFGCKVSQEPLPGNRPNFIFILTDDHRYDAMGFMGHPFLETPYMDKMAGEGIQFQRAVVTTSLCSPSRASILTGMYAHKHGVVNNYNPVDSSLIYFPQYLQDAGYETAFVGKWHMGGDLDDPRPGFDHWLSFKGQGTYWADGHGTSREVPQTSMDGYNVNGKRVPQLGYITDELTDYALEWLDQRSGEKPFFLMLSHKAVHSDFVAADRHVGKYQEAEFKIPENYLALKDRPMWVTNQKNSRHGADFAYNLPDFDIGKYYQRYCETLLAVDENLGRMMDWVETHPQATKTVVIYMGDNGFQFGEHGLIDKRTAYETSIKVPLLFWAPEKLYGGRKVEQLVANIDIAPTILDLAQISVPNHVDGISFKPLINKQPANWRSEILYEYYWERNYPYTPTMHAVISDRYKFIRYQGIWDLNEFYDLETDPWERNNLIQDPGYQALIKDYRKKLFNILEASDGNSMPLLRDRGDVFFHRNADKSRQADYPESYYLKEE